jgi:hypothetical protein
MKLVFVLSFHNEFFNVKNEDCSLIFTYGELLGKVCHKIIWKICFIKSDLTGIIFSLDLI